MNHIPTDTDNENKVCCVDCGVLYLNDQQKEEGFATTFNIGICDVCGKEKNVTSVRHYNNLEKQNK